MQKIVRELKKDYKKIGDFSFKACDRCINFSFKSPKVQISLCRIYFLFQRVYISTFDMIWYWIIVSYSIINDGKFDLSSFKLFFSFLIFSWGAIRHGMFINEILVFSTLENTSASIWKISLQHALRCRIMQIHLVWMPFRTLKSWTSTIHIIHKHLYS